MQSYVPRTGMQVENPTAHYASTPRYGIGVQFHAIGTRPCWVDGTPKDHYYELDDLLREVRADTPALFPNRQPRLTIHEIHPILTPSMGVNDYVETLRTLAVNGWNNEEEIRHDVDQQPSIHGYQYDPNMLDWPVWKEESDVMVQVVRRNYQPFQRTTERAAAI